MNKEHDMEEEDRNDFKEDQLLVLVTSVWSQSVDSASSGGYLTPGSSVVQSIAVIKSVTWLCWRKLWRIQIFC